MANLQRQWVGSAELILLQDTWAAMPPTAFFTSTQNSDWDQYKRYYEGDGNITLNIGCWAIRSEGQTILVDTGIGGPPAQFPTQGDPNLPGVMAEAGIQPEEVDIVVLTHLHFDHPGWNTIDEGGTAKPIFPNARHVVQQVEWDYWTGGDDLKTYGQYDTVLAPVEQAGLLDLVSGEHAVTNEVLTVPTPGHTPGHVSFVVSSGGEKLLLSDSALAALGAPPPGTPTDSNATTIDPTMTAALTLRENEILKLLTTGLTNQQMSRTLFISRHTVDRHVQNIYRKLGVSRRFELLQLVNDDRLPE